MEIVLDTNRLITSLLKSDLTRKIIFLSPFKMYTRCAFIHWHEGKN
jgi:predicted transcriptional regulator with HTH domain